LSLPNSVLKEILIKHNKVDAAVLNNLVVKAARVGASIGDLLVNEGIINQAELSELIAKELNVTSIDLSQTKIEKEALHTITKKISLEREAIPFKIDKKQLHVPMTNPLDLEAIDFIGKRTGLEIVPYYITPIMFEQGVLMYKKDIERVLQDMIKDHASKSVKGKV